MNKKIYLTGSSDISTSRRVPKTFDFKNQQHISDQADLLLLFLYCEVPAPVIESFCNKIGISHDELNEKQQILDKRINDNY